jgi:predicted ATPase
LAGPGKLLSAVARALDVVDQPLAETLAEQVADRQLLVLDNCEHLVQACAELVESMLRA